MYNTKSSILHQQFLEQLKTDAHIHSIYLNSHSVSSYIKMVDTRGVLPVTSEPLGLWLATTAAEGLDSTCSIKLALNNIVGTYRYFTCLQI